MTEMWDDAQGHENTLNNKSWPFWLYDARPSIKFCVDTDMGSPRKG